MQLILNTYGLSIRRRGELFAVRAGEKTVEVAAAKVDSILVTTGIFLSSDVVQLAVENNIDMVFLDEYGRPYGRFWLARMGSTAAIRRGQIEYSSNRDGLEVVRGWVRKKIENQKVFLGELARRRPGQRAEFDATVARLEVQLARIEEIEGGTADEFRQRLLGAEGAAAAAYWKRLASLPPERFRFGGRSQHPARDPFNAMLNYGYGVLYSLVDRACIVAGLDPFIGILHTDNYNKRSLVYDLIEPFRVWIDRVVLKLFTGRRCKPAMFTESADGIVLNKSAKELLLPALREYLDARILYPTRIGAKRSTRQVRRRDAIQAEAHALANRILGKDRNMPEILDARELFSDDDT